MKTNIRWNEVIKKNYPQVFFVLLAFLVMVLASYFFVSGIVRNRLLTNADDILFSAEANMRAALAESEISLNTSFPIVLNMIKRNAPREELLTYLQATTAWMRGNQRGLMGFYGIYGYVRGEFLDSLGFNPDEQYIPQTRPWYQTAVRSGNAPVAYTAPYLDMNSGETIISAVKNIIDEDGNFHGILAIDMDMRWINDYVKTLRLGRGGYGMVISQNMVIMTHPDQKALGKQLQELGEPFGDISRRLRVGEELSALQYNDPGGGRAIAFFRRMFNGWYVGLITPTTAYYRDLYNAALILSVLGFALMCSLTFLLLRISAAKMKADENSLSKSNFLAKMSHEIRTPMNAIIGMAELMLRKNLAPDVYDNASNIKQAGSSLLSLINDILDFSKIESGKLDIISGEYQLSSIINDVVAIIRMRLTEKPVHFITKIDGSLPATLIGDEARVRQVLLNLLTNAVKYTREGSITLSIGRRDGGQDKAGRDGEPPRICIAFAVADTGIGIKKEDMEKLFGNFVQFDKEQNRGVEGTGLGLAISRNLCVLMGGDIVVESVYGQGSVFTALIPQQVKDDAPFARVEEPETKATLVYENRPHYEESLVYTLNNLGVVCAAARTRDEFVAQLSRGGWKCIFTAPSLFDEVRELLPKGGSGAPEGPALALLTEYGQAARPDIKTLFMPVQPAAVASILNDSKIDSGYHEIASPGVRFTAPDARVLIVDDIEINLDVAEGLLNPYQMSIDRASGGLEATQLARENHYDLIFMDHMMPGMDGIEATAAIRAFEESHNTGKTPIVALTANAISGMKEMFLEQGFNDYVSKPIEIARLDEIMSRWIPADKRIKAGGGVKRETFDGRAEIVIPGVDIERGINMTGGTEAGYRKVLAQFYKDALERLPIFATLLDKTVKEGNGQFSEGKLTRKVAEQLSAFATQAHAIKSAAGTIGAAALSEEAAALEKAGKAGDMEHIHKALPGFRAQMTALVEAIGKTVEESGEGNGRSGQLVVSSEGGAAGDGSMLRSSLLALKAALEAKRMREIDRLLGELEGTAADSDTREAIDAIADMTLVGDYAEAVMAIDETIRVSLG
jgi:signal transduction histidine kinase/CheY-like chemotaxis protein